MRRVILVSWGLTLSCIIVSITLLTPSTFALTGEGETTLPEEFALITDSDLAEDYQAIFDNLEDMEGEVLLYLTYSETKSEINRIGALLSEQIALGNLDQSAHSALMKALWEKFNTLEYEW